MPADTAGNQVLYDANNCTELGRMGKTMCCRLTCCLNQNIVKLVALEHEPFQSSNKVAFD